ncbi:MAG: 1-deoxy-D-xylulose-5-phosphate reductoisomerase, partial [Gammaproteobacteria bacterium]
MQYLTVLGATGSIGDSTLDVVSRHPERFSVFALTAHTQVEKLASLCMTFKPRFAVVADQASSVLLAEQIQTASPDTEVLFGKDGL